MMIPQLQGETWCMQESALREFLQRAQNPELVRALQAYDGKPIANMRAGELRGSTLVLPVHGVLSREGYWWTASSSYELLLRDFQAGLDNPSVRDIVLDVDSPGGSSKGVDEFASAVARAVAAGKKEIWTYASFMCSAALWIGLAVGKGRVVIDPTALAGSIGCMTTVVDFSKFEEKMGIVVWDIVSTQSPYKAIDPSSKDDRSRLQEMVTKIATRFVDQVAMFRQVDAKKVLSDFGKGDVLIGQEAVDAGLVDRVGDMETLLAELANGSNNERANFIMGKSQAPGVNASIGDEKCDGCGRDMDDDDETYCRACHSETDAIRSMLGIDAKAAIATVLARVTELVALERDVLAHSGEKTLPAALGKIAGAFTAATELQTVRAENEKQKAQALQGQFRVALEDRRLQPGHLTSMVPLFLSGLAGKDENGSPAPSERDKAKAAIAGVTSQKREDLVKAICCATADAQTLEQLKAFTETLQPLPDAREQPPASAAQRGQVIAASAKEIQAAGMKPEAFQKFANTYCVADIEKQAKEDAQKKKGA